MNYTAKERRRYNEDRDRACQRLNITVNQYNWLRRKGEELRKVYIDACNGKLETEQEEELSAPLEQSINKYAHKLGLNIFYQTDPRGATIYADREYIPENNYTQAVCIY